MGNSNFKTIYTPDICNYSDIKILKGFIARPDIVAEGLGDYCGDMCNFRIRINQGLIEVEPEISACILTRASASILLEKVQGKGVEAALAICQKGLGYLLDKSTDFDGIEELTSFNNTSYLRENCVILPWRIMQKGLEKAVQKTRGNTCSIDDNVYGGNMLACDSCVATQTIKVSNGVTSKAKGRLEKRTDFFTGKEYSFKVSQGDVVTLSKNTYKKVKEICGVHVGRLGKVYLNKEEIEGLEKLLLNWDDTYINLFREFRSPAIIAYNIKHLLKKKVPKKLLEFVRAKNKSSEIYLKEWLKICSKFQTLNIPFSGVKGIATYHMYNSTKMRVFSDIDLIVPDIGTFFNVVSVLKYELGYDFTKELGQSASLKKLSRGPNIGNDNFVLTGHSHMERLVDGVFVEFDISFPNLPSGPESLLITDLDYKQPYCNTTNLLVTNIDHILKHTHQPMRDINDCYIMIKSGTLDWPYLNRLIINNGLEFVSQAVFNTMIKYFDISSQSIEIDLTGSLALMDKLVLSTIMKMEWPFSKEAHELLLLYIKRRKRKGNTNINVDLPTYKPLERDETLLEDNEKYLTTQTALLESMKVGKRIYLIPLVSFINKVEINNSIYDYLKFMNYFKVEWLCINCLKIKYQHINLLLSETGIMIFTEWFEISKADADNWMKVCTEILSALKLSDDNYRIRLEPDSNNSSWTFR